jgi:hypothetical protein
VKATDFTRERVLNWRTVVVLSLSGHKVSLQNAVNKFFCGLGQVWRVVTARAYSPARQKVQSPVFVHLNAVVCEEYYSRYGADHAVVLWHGQRVVGGEGSYVNLPATEETRRRVSVQTNQPLGGEQGQALASVL